MINNILNFIFLFPLYFILNAFNIPFNVTVSLYKSIYDFSFDNSYLFLTAVLALTLCYGFSELIAITAIMPHVFVFTFCYLFLVTSLSLAITIRYIDNDFCIDISDMYKKSNELILQNERGIRDDNVDADKAANENDLGTSNRNGV
ncbi:MAG: hypothetical protein HON55_02785 [Legionellales bacterium]|jgi:hypothetical protein|nr:hypothetical protein [Legionellales bacterium]